MSNSDMDNIKYPPAVSQRAASFPFEPYNENPETAGNSFVEEVAPASSQTNKNLYTVEDNGTDKTVSVSSASGVEISDDLKKLLTQNMTSHLVKCDDGLYRYNRKVFPDEESFYKHLLVKKERRSFNRKLRKAKKVAKKAVKEFEEKRKLEESITLKVLKRIADSQEMYPVPPGKVQNRVTLCERDEIKSELQVMVKLADSNRTFTFEDGDVLKGCLQSEMIRLAERAQTDGSQPQLGFDNMGVTDRGRFLISPVDVFSRDWLLYDWRPPIIAGQQLSVELVGTAHGETDIFILLREEQCHNVNQMLSILQVQNQDMAIDSWKFKSKTINNKSGNVKFIFSVNKNGKKALETNNWTVFYELACLQVKPV